MQISNGNKQFLTYVSKYLGVALIAGSVVHIGTLDNSFLRYVVLMAIGLILMMIGNILEAKANGQKINTKYLLLITGLSFTTGFLSGGVQHYLDNPSYAGVLLSIGLVGAYVTYFIKENMSLKRKNLIFVIIISIFIIIFSNYIMDDVLLGANHHDNTTTQSTDIH